MTNVAGIDQGRDWARKLELYPNKSMHIHAISKAIFYLTYERMSAEKRYDLIVKCKQALSVNKWEDLAVYMRKWW